ncbi:MAG: hypothetical protein ACK4RM_09175 [Flavobacterium sp.]
MKNLTILVFIIISNIAFGQPGPSGGMLAIKIYREGKQIDLPNENWQIIPTNITLADSKRDNPDKGDKFYYIIPVPTPVGGDVDNDFYLDIVLKKDTMRIYPPSFRHQNIVLDSIPFQKGVYKIPQSVYDFKKISKKGAYYGKLPVPNLYGDWNLFTNETYKCYIEKTEDLDYVPNDNGFYGEEKYDFKHHWQNLYVLTTGTSYYFNDNVIIAYKYSSGTTTIYEVKNFSDNHYWYSLHRPSVRSLFYKDNQLFAIIYKAVENCGVYKLHFVDEEPTENLHYLEKKQVIEEYEAELKRLKVYDKGYREREIPQVTKKFNEIMKTLEIK